MPGLQNFLNQEGMEKENSLSGKPRDQRVDDTEVELVNLNNIKYKLFHVLPNNKTSRKNSVQRVHFLENQCVKH